MSKNVTFLINKNKTVSSLLDEGSLQKEKFRFCESGEECFEVLYFEILYEKAGTFYQDNNLKKRKNQ